MPHPVDLARLEADLSSVRGVIERSPMQRPAAIPLLWAAIVLVGFAVVDLAPRRAGPYWLVASAGGFLVSAWLGRRAARRSGQRDPELARRERRHWAGLLVGLLLLGPLVATGGLDGTDAGRASLLLVALAYWLDGVHRAPVNRRVAVALAAGYLLTFTAHAHVWLWVGALVAAALVASSLTRRTPRADLDP